jgi:hypothetical protein
MQQSSQRAASVLMAHGCSSCTDVTGFGLLGHMVEMAQASQVGRIPLHMLVKEPLSFLIVVLIVVIPCLSLDLSYLALDMEYKSILLALPPTLTP